MNPGKTTGSVHMKVHAALISSESELDTSDADADALAQPL